ncbi:hypothetical protein SAMN05661091_0869 [Paenibacillus uliginis N3/975]|uniref:Uncharacterized protein n=1 Tax=Paenibacillus uliginis N3/975 TaxID=1313296 RepID=A0A1X7GNI9_9BACL|nr:hypothetical protein [Paenibacillus uliginis]SMF72439.1 hypothetical protein SAMN05661091_0869 [Paenibacillus uliginis N3/975]
MLALREPTALVKQQNLIKPITLEASLSPTLINNLIVVNKHVNILENHFTDVSVEIGKAADEQQSLNDAIQAGTQEAGLLSQVFSGLKKVQGAMQFVAEMMIVPAAKEQALEDLMKVRVGNPEVGTAMFDKFKQDALRTGMDVSETMNNALSFMSMTKNSDQVSELNNFAARLSKLTPGDKSSSDATAAIMGAMRGDTGALAEEFNIPEGHLDEFNNEVQASRGNFAAFLVSMDQLLQKSGMTQEGLNTMLDTPLNQWQQLLGNVNSSFAQMGTGALEALAPLLEMLNTAFDSGSFDPFIQAISIGLAFIAQMFLWIAEIVPPAWEFLKNVISSVGFVLYPLIAGILLLISIFTVGKVISTLFSTGINTLSTTFRGLWTVMNANPFMRIISLIIGIVTVILSLMLASEGVRQAFSNAFGSIVNFAQDTVNTVIKVINGALTGINKISGFFADLLGVNAKEIALIEYRADYSNFKDAGQDAIKDFSMDNLKKKFMPKIDTGEDNNDLLKQFNEGKTGPDVSYPKTTSGVVPSNVPMSSAPMPKTPVPVSPAGGSIDSIGKVDNSVDVASEDLKVMRDLAEVNAISNMITLTPTVQMTTGDINSGADLDTIMSRINRTLEEQFVSSAEGVYL